MNLQIAVVNVGADRVAVEHGKDSVYVSVLNQKGVEPLVKITKGPEGLEVRVSDAYLKQDMRGNSWGQFVDLESSQTP